MASSFFHAPAEAISMAGICEGGESGRVRDKASTRQQVYEQGASAYSVGWIVLYLLARQKGTDLGSHLKALKEKSRKRLLCSLKSFEVLWRDEF